MFLASLLTVLSLVLWAALFPYADMPGKAGISFILMLIACILCFPACAIVIWNVSQVGSHSLWAKHARSAQRRAAPVSVQSAQAATLAAHRRTHALACARTIGVVLQGARAKHAEQNGDVNA